MKKTTILAIALFTLLFSNVLIAQENTKNVTISLDPTLFAFGGYGFEAGFQQNHHSIAFTTVKVDHLWNTNDKFEANRAWAELLYTYYLNAEQKGFYFGGGLAYYYNEEITEIETGDIMEKDFAKVGIRIGYFWNIWNGLYFNPSFNVGVKLSDDDLTFASGEVFEKTSVDLHGLLFNFGYKITF